MNWKWYWLMQISWMIHVCLTDWSLWNTSEITWHSIILLQENISQGQINDMNIWAGKSELWGSWGKVWCVIHSQLTFIIHHNWRADWDLSVFMSLWSFTDTVWRIYKHWRKSEVTIWLADFNVSFGNKSMFMRTK